MLEDAGRLSIPFTTGILVGIGENRTERAESIFAIRKIAREFGSIQEVIIQNFRAKDDTAMRNEPDLEVDEYLAAVATARVVLGPSIRLQAPPNLVELEDCVRLLNAGVDDWGGISPLTPDHVNPERPWPQIDDLAQLLKEHDFELRERLTAHPHFVRDETPWLDPRILPHVRALAGPDGLADENAIAHGLDWQEPDPEWVASGRVDLHTAVDTEGRTDDRRSDFDDVYGDWAEVAQRVHTSAPIASLSSEVVDALRQAERNAMELTEAQGLAMMTADGADLDAVARLADDAAPRHRR